MDGSFSEILRECRAWHKLPVIKFLGDPAGILNSGLLWNFRYHCFKGGTRKPLAKRRWWRHLANSFALVEVPAGYDCFSSFKNIITEFFPNPYICMRPIWLGYTINLHQ